MRRVCAPARPVVGDPGADARDRAHWSGGELLELESAQHGAKLLGDSAPTQGR